MNLIITLELVLCFPLEYSNAHFEHLVNKSQLLDPLLKSPIEVSIHDNKMNPVFYPAVKVFVLPAKKN